MNNGEAAEETRKKIIVVDDVKFHLLSLRECLKKRYDIFPAQSMEELFDVLKSVKPDLILLDINMPETDGFEVFEMLKSSQAHSKIPVMFLTSQMDRNTIVKGMRLGAVGFVQKPYKEEDLVERIETELNPDVKTKNQPVILAVDDNISILKSMHALLCSKYKVCTLPNPERIKELLRSVEPDLFILDCNMPILSGFDLVPIIRKHPEHQDTPIIFLTSEGTMDTVNAALHSGASDFMVKPVDDAKLIERVDHHLSNYRTLRQIRLCK
ncbi:MAG: response regulator [Oscillospiraceae bacterium]|nr:response regulator [Oscillospiraceae bacterium]